MSRSNGHKKHSKALGRMARQGSAQVKQAVHAMTSIFAEIYDQSQIKEVVVGDLGGIKKNKDGTGKDWND